MARSPSRGRNRPHSVGSFAAFFDFYQKQDALSILNDGKGEESSNGAGSERLEYDANKFIPMKEEQNQRMSVRDMLAQFEPSEELTKELKSKAKPFNVVAKLMGLETLPESIASVQKKSHSTTNEGIASIRYYHHSKTASLSSAGQHYGNDDKDTAICGMDYPFSLSQSNWEEPPSELKSRAPSYEPESINCEVQGRSEEAVDNKENQKETRHIHLLKQTCPQERFHDGRLCQRMCSPKDSKDNIRSFPGEDPVFLFTRDNKEELVPGITMKIRPPLESDSEASKFVSTHSDMVRLSSLGRKRRPMSPFPILDDAPRNHMRVRKILNAVKLLVKKTLAHNKYWNTRDELCEEKELTNTISFLEANRDYFRKFLKDPHPKSSKRSQAAELNLLKGSIREYNDFHENHVDGLHKTLQMDKPELLQAQIIAQNVPYNAERGLIDHQGDRKQVVDIKHPAAVSIVVLRPGTGKMVVLPSDRSLNTMKNAEEDETDVFKELRGKFQLPRSESAQSRGYRSSTDNESIARQYLKHVREQAFGHLAEDFKLRSPESNYNGKFRKIEMCGRDKHVQKGAVRSQSVWLSDSRSDASSQDVCEGECMESTTGGRHPAGSELERESLSSSTQNIFHVSTSLRKQVSPISSPGMNLHSKGEQFLNYKRACMKLQKNALDCPQRKPYGSIRGACREAECDKHCTMVSHICTPTNHNLHEDHTLIIDIAARHYEQFLKIVENTCRRSANSPSESSMRLSGDEMMSITSDISKDSSGQPSPISVLDASFPHSASSKASTSTELQDLEMRIRFLNALQQQRAEESSQFEEADHSTDGNTSQLPIHIYNFEDSVSNDGFIQGSVDFLVDGIDCPKGTEPVLLYLRNLLIESGIAAVNTASLPYLYDSSDHLANSIFEKMESKRLQIVYNICNNQLKGRKKDLFKPLLYFDRVKEMLHDILQPKPNCIAFLQGVNLDPQRLRPNLIGEGILKTMWDGVCELLHSEVKSKETLDTLAENDLCRCPLLEFDLNIEKVVFEVEREILNDVILEMIKSFCSVFS